MNVTSISPPTGLTLAPVQVRVTGFQSGATLLIGDVATPANVVTSTLITATAPPHAAGTVDIVVTNPGGQSSRLAGAFTCLLAVTSLMVSGNTTLTAVGATSQLTATASFADGTTGDVTQSVQWSALIPSVATVARDGVLTARALGATYIYARHGTGDLTRSTSVVRSVGVHLS